jgi:chlorobactene glucosyltransferase
MIAYHVVILAFLLCMAVIAVVNVLTIHTLTPVSTVRRRPLVSILIPARNEASVIRTCMEALANQKYPSTEVIVLDDQSNDDTALVVRAYSDRIQGLRVVRGLPLPAGWVGKNYACHQLSALAEGEVLIFLDADTKPAPWLVNSVLAYMAKTGAGMVSVLPRQVMGSFWEKVVLPLFYFVTFGLLPFPLVHRTRDQRFAMANGQCLAFTTTQYRAMGGHAAVRSAIVEDVWLARLAKRSGGTLRVVDGGDGISCRMYRSFGEIWRGFTKNIFAGVGYSISALTGVTLFLLTTSILPYVFLAMKIINWHPGMTAALVMLQVIVLIEIRIVLALRYRTGVLSVLFHPIGVGLMIVIGVVSAVSVLFGRGARWKGRIYNFYDEAAGGG